MMDNKRTRHGKGFFLVFFFMFVSYIPSIYAAERIIIVAPLDAHFAGQPLVFHVQLQNVLSPKAVTAFYKAPGASVFKSIALAQQSPQDFVGMVSGREIRPPGVEYYFIVTDGQNRNFSFPEIDPRVRPYQLSIKLDRKPPEIIVATPEVGESVNKRRPQIRIQYQDSESGVDVGTVRLTLDNTDITPLAMVSETDATYEPEADLTPGDHSVSVELMDKSGNRMPKRTIPFTVPGPVFFDDADAKLQWDAEARQKIWSKDSNQEAHWAVQSSLGLASYATKDDWKASLDANVWYTEESGSGPLGDKFNLNRFLAQLEKGKNVLAFGDVSVRGTELISETISRRGGRAFLDFSGTEIEGYILRSYYGTDFKTSLEMRDPEQRLVGGSIQRGMLSNNKLLLKAAYVQGKNEDPASANVGTTALGNSGKVASFVAKSNIIDEKLVLTGEFSRSDFNVNSTDDEDGVEDNAWLARAAGRDGFYDWSLGYKYLGQDYHSVVNPSGAGNREEYAFDGGLTGSMASVRANVMHTRDNVGDDPDLPVVRSSSATLGYNVFPQGWPTMFANLGISHQGSSHEPVATLPLDVYTRFMSVGLTVAREHWNLTPSYTLTLVDDQSSNATTSDSETHVLSLAGGWQPNEHFSLNPMVSYTSSSFDSTGETTATWQGALSSVLAINEEHDFNFTASILDNKTNTNSIYTRIYNCLGQYNWHLEKYLLKTGKQTFSIRGQYTRTEDRVAETEVDDYSIYGVFSIGLPMDLY